MAYYPRSIRFAPIEEWTIKPNSVKTKEGYEQGIETVYEGWVEQEDGLRNKFEVLVRTGNTSDGHEMMFFIGPHNYSEVTSTPVPPGKVWIRHINIDRVNVLGGRLSPNAIGYSNAVMLYEDWRFGIERNHMFYNCATKKIE